MNIMKLRGVTDQIHEVLNGPFLSEACLQQGLRHGCHDHTVCVIVLDGQVAMIKAMALSYRSKK